MDIGIDLCQYQWVTEFCCSSLLDAPLAADEAETMAVRFKALADPTRLRLISMIAAAGDVCGCELVEPLGLSQPTVSHHLKVLYEAGLLARERRGRWIHYRVDDTGIGDLSDALAAPAPVN